MKAISGNHIPKLQNFKPHVPWPAFMEKKLCHAFWRHLKHADEQIRDFRRIIGFKEARGVTIVINDGSPSLTSEMVHAFLTRELGKLPNTDAIIYLSDGLVKYEMATIYNEKNA